MVTTVTHDQWVNRNAPIPPVLPADIHHWTFTFDETLQNGHFLNGVPWVVAPSGCTLRTTTPTSPTGPPGTGYLNGIQIGGRGNTISQGIDYRVGPGGQEYSSALSQTLPILNLQPNQVVIIGESRMNSGDTQEYIHGSTGYGNLNYAGMCFILDYVPSTTAFAPPWGGAPALRSSLLYDTSQIQWSRLPNLPLPASTARVPANTGSWAPIPRQTRFWTRSPWLDLLNNWEAGVYEGARHEPTYGQVWMAVISQCMTRCMFESPDPSNDLGQTVINLIQHGIDSWALMLDGRSGGADGGHMRGRKFLAAFAKLMLGTTWDLNTPTTGTPGAPSGLRWCEDEMFFYDNTDDFTGGRAKWCKHTGTTDLGGGRGHQQWAPSTPWAGQRSPGATAAFYLEGGYHIQNVAPTVGAVFCMWMLGAFQNLGYGKAITHTRGNNSTPPGHLVAAADISYDPAIALFEFFDRYMSQSNAAVIAEYLAGAGIPWSFDSGQDLDVGDCTNFARECWYAYRWKLGPPDGWQVLGRGPTDVQAIGVIDNQLPLLITVLPALPSASIKFHVYGCPLAASITSVEMLSSFPKKLPVLFVSPPAGTTYYAWYGGTASGTVPPDADSAQDVTPTSTAMALPNAYGYTSLTLVLPATTNLQTTFLFQVRFNMVDLTTRTTNAMLCLL